MTMDKKIIAGAVAAVCIVLAVIVFYVQPAIRSAEKKAAPAPAAQVQSGAGAAAESSEADLNRDYQINSKDGSRQLLR
jgi:hypothetical protein